MIINDVKQVQKLKYMICSKQIQIINCLSLGALKQWLKLFQIHLISNLFNTISLILLGYTFMCKREYSKKIILQCYWIIVKDVLCIYLEI